MNPVAQAAELPDVHGGRTFRDADAAWERLRFRFQYFVTQTQRVKKPVALVRLEYAITCASLAVAAYLSLSH